MELNSTEIERLTRSGKKYSIRLCAECLSQRGSQHLRQHITDAFNSMSNRTRQQRFATPLHTLTDNHLDYLTRLDATDRVAWCAFVQSENEERGIGLARYVRLEDETQVAEFAVTVVDEFQGQGIGTELLNQLIETARSNSIHTLRGYILPHNEAMLALCRRLNAYTVREDASTIRADIQIQN